MTDKKPSEGGTRQAENPKGADGPLQGAGKQRNRRPRHRQPPAVAPSSGGAGAGAAALTLAVLALALGLALAVGGWFVWQETQQTHRARDALGGRMDSRIGELQGHYRDLAQQLRGEWEDQRRRVEDTLGAVGRQQAAMADQLAVLRSQVGRSEAGWAVAEAQYLMRVANQRLQIQRDVTTALAALESADQQLRSLADPALLPVREALAKEITALRGVSTPDIVGVALTLNTLSESVPGLQPRGVRKHQAPATAPGNATDDAVNDWRELPRAVGRALTQLVAIRRHEEPVTPMLAPEHEFFLRQNLRLKLATARLAALREDTGNFHASLETAREWLAEYFAATDPASQAMIEQLRRLEALELRPSLPDVSGSLGRLREYANLHGHGEEGGAAGNEVTGRETDGQGAAP